MRIVATARYIETGFQHPGMIVRLPVNITNSFDVPKDLHNNGTLQPTSMQMVTGLLTPPRDWENLTFRIHGSHGVPVPMHQRLPQMNLQTPVSALFPHMDEQIRVLSYP